MSPLQPQVILLAGGATNELYPLTEDGKPQALLPVANRVLLSYPLRMLERSGVKSAIVVCEGEATASQVSAWIDASHDGAVQLQVVTVRDGCGSAEVLREVLPQLEADSVVLMRADLVSQLSLQEVVAVHWLRHAAATMVFTKRRGLASTETKPGRAPKGVDYVGTDTERQQVLMFCPSPTTRRDVRMPLNVLTAATQINVTTTLKDCQLYVFARTVLQQALETLPDASSVQGELLPYLLRHQVAPPQASGQTPFAMARTTSSSMASVGDGGCTPEQFTVLNHAPPRGLGAKAGVPGASGWFVGLYCPPEGVYCARVDSVQAYGDVNREVSSPDLAADLAGADAPLAPGVQTGNKTTVAAGCLVGRGSVLGDKCSAKRSVIGANCRLGNNVKVINSVIMDGVVVEDGVHVQNCVVGLRAHLHQRCSLRDCQVGAEYLVAEGLEVVGEVLAKGKVQGQ